MVDSEHHWLALVDHSWFDPSQLRAQTPRIQVRPEVQPPTMAEVTRSFSSSAKGGGSLSWDPSWFMASLYSSGYLGNATKGWPNKARDFRIPDPVGIVGEVVAWFHHIARLAVWRYSDGKNPCLYRQMFHRVSWSHMFMSLEARNRRSQNPRRFFCPKNCSNGVTFRSSSTTLMAWFRALWCVVNGHPSQMEI